MIVIPASLRVAGRTGKGMEVWCRSWSGEEDVGDFLDCVLAEDVLSVDEHLGPAVCQVVNVGIAAIGKNCIPEALAVEDVLSLEIGELHGQSGLVA